MLSAGDKPQDVVRRTRAFLGLSQARFGLILGCSQGVVSKYEKGTVMPSAEALMQCLHILQGYAQGSEGHALDPWDAVRQAMAQLSIALAIAQRESR